MKKLINWFKNSENYTALFLTIILGVFGGMCGLGLSESALAPGIIGCVIGSVVFAGFRESRKIDGEKSYLDAYIPGTILSLILTYLMWFGINS